MVSWFQQGCQDHLTRKESSFSMNGMGQLDGHMSQTVKLHTVHTVQQVQKLIQINQGPKCKCQKYKTLRKKLREKS